MTITAINTMAAFSDEQVLRELKALIDSGLPNIRELMNRGYDVSVFLSNGEVKFSNLGAPEFRVKVNKELKA